MRMNTQQYRGNKMRETYAIKTLAILIREILTREAKHHSLKAIHEFYEEINACATLLRKEINLRAKNV